MARRYGQPQGLVELARGNPLTRGLTVVFNAGYSHDLISNAGFTLGGSKTVGRQGVAISASSTQKAFLLADSEAQRSTLVSEFALLRRTATVEPNFDAIGKNFQTSSSPSFVSDSIAYNPGGAGQDVIRANQGVSGGIVNTGNYTHPDTTRWHTVGASFGDGSAVIVVDGVIRSTVAAGAIAYGSSGDNSFGHNFGGKTGGFEIALGLRWNRILSAAEWASLNANPWQIFQDSRPALAVAAASGVTGTLAKTNANDTSSAAGTTTVTGSLARTNASDTSAASGSTTVVGSLAKTNANDSVSASGSTTVKGTLARTNANDTLAASGSVGGGTITGSVAYTNAADTLAGAGSPIIVGSLAKTNANDSLVASGWAGKVTGTLARTNNNDTLAAVGNGNTSATRKRGLRKTRYVPRRVVGGDARLTESLNGELERINDGLESPFTHGLYEILHTEPERKLQTAITFAFADGADWNPGSGRGWYYYDPDLGTWNPW